MTRILARFKAAARFAAPDYDAGLAHGDSGMSDIKSMAVIGAGTMGSGIALTAAHSGIRAYQIDVAPAQLEKAKKTRAEKTGAPK